MLTLCSIMKWHLPLTQGLGQATCCKLADYLIMAACTAMQLQIPQQVKICHYVSCSLDNKNYFGYMKGATK